MDSPRYEARFYEWQALCHVASLLNAPVLTNVRQFRPGTRRLQLPEIDGLMEAGGSRTLIEIKSYCLAQEDVDSIVAKYTRFRPETLLLVAPSYSSDIVLPRYARIVSFLPDLSALKQTYWGQAYKLPPRFEEELGSGEHHFRYVSACRRKGEVAKFRNQVDKGIKNVFQVFRDIRRQNRPCDLPVRVFWSVSRWLFPKELFFSSYRNHLVRRGLVFDIDGSAIHNASTPCELVPGHAICGRCFVAAKKAATQLVRLLAQRGFSEPNVIFSGRQGFHVYVFEKQLLDSDVRELSQAVLAEGIPIDANLTLDRKSVVTFPGSVHGMSMLRAVPVQDLESSSLQKILASQ